MSGIGARRRARPFQVERATDIDRDLALIFDFLYDTHRSFGYDADEASALAAKRVRQIERDLAALGRAPHQGTEQPHLVPGLREVTKDRAIFYFVVDDPSRTLRVLAVFFGGQDHQLHMLHRLLARKP